MGDIEGVLVQFFDKIQESQKLLPSRFSAPVDFERVLRLYNDKLILQQLDRFIDNSKNIGYEIYKADDNVTCRTTLFVLFSAGAALRATIDHIRAKHEVDMRGTTLIALLPKEREQTALDRRLQNVKTLLSPTNVFYLDEFVWQYCTPVSLHRSDTPFEITGFVEPSIESVENDSALSLLRDWYWNHPTPVLVIRGSGGIGKTTLAQWFVNEISGSTHARTFFVEDDAICDYFLKTPDINVTRFTIYDAYLAHVAQWSGEVEAPEILSFERFMLNFDSGNIFLIIDGLDQVMSRLGSAFPIEDFMESLYTDDPNQRRKIVITSRSVFLPEAYFSHQVTVLERNPISLVHTRRQ